MIVLVFTPDTEEPLGMGDLCRYEDITLIDDDDNIIATLKNHPVIVMEDGEVLRGIECWWYPL
jgi:hypothetical protein